MDTNFIIVNRIDTLLFQKNLKRQVLYDLAQVAPNTFSNWMKKANAKIPAQTLYVMAEYLGVSIDFLLTGKDRSGLDGEEIRLVTNYRQLSDDDKDSVNSMIDHFLQRSIENEKKEMA